MDLLGWAFFIILINMLLCCSALYFVVLQMWTRKTQMKSPSSPTWSPTTIISPRWRLSLLKERGSARWQLLLMTVRLMVHLLKGNPFIWLFSSLYPPPPPLLQVLDNCVEAEKIVNRYEALASDLLDWIEKTIAVISNQKFANSLTGVQQQLQAFTTYCTIEKPIK